MNISYHENTVMKTTKRKSVAFTEQSSSKRRKGTERRDKSADQEHAIDEDVFMKKIHARPINERYVLDHKLGEGGFGIVFLGKDITNGEKVALKLEHRSVVPSILEDEAQRCEQFQDLEGFPKFYWYGWHDHYKVMAFELLGPSLEDLFAYCDGLFSLKTAFMLMDQLLRRLQSLHARGVLHRDIKPQNCLMGTGTKGNVVYVTDFGLAEDASPNDDSPGTDYTKSRLVGTARYASIRGHEGRTQSFQDDLESLVYMIIYLTRGRLPWQGLKGGREERGAIVMEKKKSTRIEDLCAELPKEFVECMRYVRQLKYGEMPDYGRMRRLFRRRAKREGWEYDGVFDWTTILFLQRNPAR